MSSAPDDEENPVAAYLRDTKPDYSGLWLLIALLIATSAAVIAVGALLRLGWRLAG